MRGRRGHNSRSRGGAAEAGNRGAENVPHVTEVENAGHWTNFMQKNWHTIGAYVMLETIVLPWLAVSVEEKQVVRIITILMCMKMIGY